MGGKTAIDATLAAPERVTALVAVGAAVSGLSFRAYSDDQGARAEAAWMAGDYEGAADVWLEVWAPLCTDDRLREIAYTNAAIDFDELELARRPARGRAARRASRPDARPRGRHGGAGDRRLVPARSRRTSTARASS